MDLLERAPVLDELDGVLATATTGGRVVLLAGEAGGLSEPLVRRPASVLPVRASCEPPRASGGVIGP
jgi:hypothetical protein